MKLKAIHIAAAVATLPIAAHAALWDGTGGSPHIIPAVNAQGTGPENTLGTTWTSTNATILGGATYGWTLGYYFQGNGYWSGIPMEGLDDSSNLYGVVDSMTFTFTKPIAAFGGEINWIPNEKPVTIAAYDSSGNLLDSLTLSAGDANLETPDGFYGFIEGSPDIKSFVMTDGFIGIENIEAIGLPTVAPEPAAWALSLVGLGLLGVTLRANRNRRAAMVAG
ncbi:MAG TPA: PEP-CTERM sorting domain-containing protein [Caulobacteraceae bacterium]|jgi:hypothetical protein